MNKITIQFEGGISRHGDYAVNFLLAQGMSDDYEPIYAECKLPFEEASSDYGYLALKADIIEQAAEQGIDANMLDFWYDGQEDKLEADAATDVRIDRW